MTDFNEDQPVMPWHSLNPEGLEQLSDPLCYFFLQMRTKSIFLKKIWFLLEYSGMTMILRTCACMCVYVSVCLVGLCVYPHACTCACVYFGPDSHCVWSRYINAKLL